VRGAFAATGVFLLMLSASPTAHRLDEYLQAARVSFARTGIVLDVDLTPGASVAAGIIALIDRDGDNRISPLEAESYGRVVLTGLLLELDDRPVPLTLVHVEAPSTDEMRYGLGTIQLRAIGKVEGVSRRPQLHFRNNHQAGSSVYLVNALIPGDTDVSVVGQTRDARQQDVRIEYNISPQWPKNLYWPAFGLVVGGWWFMRARRSTNH